MNIIIMNNLIKFSKLIFYFLNIILIILYLFPGSIFGYFLYNDLNIQPQITRDFIISSNHFYAFALLYVLSSIILLESSREAGGLPIIYILKSYIILMSVTLFLQALSELIKNSGKGDI